MLKLVKHILEFVKEYFIGLGCILLGSVSLVITGIIGEAVFPDSEGYVPIIKFILLLLGVMFVVAIIVVGPFAVLKAIWSARKARKLYIRRLEDIIGMTYTIIHSTPDEYIKNSLCELFRSRGIGQNEQRDPLPEDNDLLDSVGDVLQGRSEDDTSDPTSRESSSDTKPDF